MEISEQKRIENMWGYLNEANIYSVEELQKALNKSAKGQQKLYTYINTSIDFNKIKNILPTLNYYKQLENEIKNSTSEELNYKIEKLSIRIKEYEKELEFERKINFSVDRIKNKEFALYRAEFELEILKNIKI